MSNIDDKMRIVQELVPGKQITLAHIIANPDKVLYDKLGLEPSKDYSKCSIGILTVTPAETAIICADIATKSSGASLGFIERNGGTLIITGSVSELESSFNSIAEYCRDVLGYEICNITKT